MVRQVKASPAPTDTCLVCRLPIEFMGKRGLRCLRCKFLNLKPFPKPVGTILQQLKIDWIGRYYSSLDPRVLGRFVFRKQRNRKCADD